MTTNHDADLINSSVKFIPQDMLMQDAVQMMIDQRISSVLVIDAQEHVVGILTERDIVHKFTLLDMNDKLSRNVATVMTRGVRFVRAKRIKQDITKLHLEYKFRHFPILAPDAEKIEQPKKEHIVGIVSITDLARQHLAADTIRRRPPDAEAPPKILIGVLSKNRAMTNTYIDIFRGMGFDPREVADLHRFLTAATAQEQTLIVDLDGYTDKELHDIIPVAVKSRGYLILTTSNPSLVPVFKKYINKSRQDIAMKPIDISYLSWILTKKWQVQMKQESDEEEEE